MTKVIIDKDGQLLNIGPWDYMEREKVTDPLPDDAVQKMKDGWDYKIETVATNSPPDKLPSELLPFWDYKKRNIATNPLTKAHINAMRKAWDYKVITVITNPLPEGAVESDEDVTDLEDGSRVLSSEVYKHNRKSEYPNPVEQLDYIYHNGVAAWKNDMIKPIKDKYPKGE